MKVLITGGAGQLANELVRTKPRGAEVIAPTHRELDITDGANLSARIRREAPDVVVNTAAYTAVDKAESEHELAYRINAAAPGYVAAVVNEIGAHMVQLSTDFVFSGREGSPYKPGSETDPLSIYGKSKRDGENAAKKSLSTERLLVLRTAWVYSIYGNNFLKTMLRIMNERRQVNVVGDQIGTPTSAHTLAQALWCAIDLGIHGVHHWTDAGTASWYDFAVAIHEEATQLDLIDPQVQIREIRTVDYPTPARRPAYSVLDKTDTWRALDQQPDHWRVALRHVLHELQARDAT